MGCVSPVNAGFVMPSEEDVNVCITSRQYSLAGGLILTLTYRARWTLKRIDLLFPPRINIRQGNH